MSFYEQNSTFETPSGCCVCSLSHERSSAQCRQLAQDLETS